MTASKAHLHGYASINAFVVLLLLGCVMVMYRNIASHDHWSDISVMLLTYHVVFIHLNYHGQYQVICRNSKIASESCLGVSQAILVLRVEIVPGW